LATTPLARKLATIKRTFSLIARYANGFNKQQPLVVESHIEAKTQIFRASSPPPMTEKPTEYLIYLKITI
jgi:hypothetical protein